MRTHFDEIIRINSQRLAGLKRATAALERQLSDTRMSVDHERPQPVPAEQTAPGQARETCTCAWHDTRRGHNGDAASVRYAPRSPGDDYDGEGHSPDRRTAALVSHGRHSAYHRRLSVRAYRLAATTAIVTLLVIILAMLTLRGGASWPPSVATVQSEISKACQNPDAKSEPGQVNFACGKTTSQILWVFSLMTSDDNPNFTDTRTGRVGLEPITPVQGGEVASSLNLHHPYNPFSPIDSIEVAARAINDIVGGATLTGPDGNPIVQAGLESNSANCVRYTGSAAIISHEGFPALCAEPTTSPAGQAALVADIYRKWIVGTSAKAAQDAAVLFENAKDPGDPRVQFILKHLPQSRLSG